MRARALLGSLLLLAGACTTEGLAFIEDRRVEITGPEYRELLQLPVTVDWDVVDESLEDRLGSDVSFGVYVDVDPQPPGESLEYFARDDVQCRRSPGCPDARYFGQRGIHTTTDSEITFNALPIAPGVDVDRGDPDFHEVTLVLLDADGKRIGESAWAIIFEVQRGGDA